MVVFKIEEEVDFSKRKKLTNPLFASTFLSTAKAVAFNGVANLFSESDQRWNADAYSSRSSNKSTKINTKIILNELVHKYSD